MLAAGCERKAENDALSLRQELNPPAGAYIGRMGAGDLKFLSVIGLYVGPAAALKVALYAMLAGGLLALLYLCLPAGRFKEGKHIPYAVAISIGAVLVLGEMS